MHHIDGMSLLSAWPHRGQSPFARPVAAATTLVQRVARTVMNALKPRGGRSQVPEPGRKELEVRQREEHFARATDLNDLERMERDWGRRDGGGLRNWDRR